MMSIQEIQQEIRDIESRIQFLEQDRTRMVSVWAGPKGYEPYNHGPYLRRLEKKKLRAKLRRRIRRLELLRSNN
jgi:hypothetical protein